MKYFSIILIITFNCFTFSYSETFNLMPLKIHYLGSVGAGDNIIAYGTNGAYLLSTDKGQSWRQKCIAQRGQINKIVNYNDTLWGVVNYGNVIRSVNNGLNWEQFNVLIDTSNRLINIIISDNFVYVRSLKSILRYDKDMNLINHFENVIIESKIDSFYYKPKVYYENYSVSNIFLLKNDLLIDLISENNGFAKLTSELENFKMINMKGKVYTTNPEYYNLNDIYKIKDENIFNIGGNLYRMSDDYNNWNFFFQDSLFMNRSDSLIYLKRWINDNTYFTDNEDLYGVSLEGNDQGSTNMLIKIYSEIPKDTFKLINKHYINKYQTIGAENKGCYDLSSGLFTKKCNILKNGIYVKAGMSRSLMISADKGANWSLLSFLSGVPEKIVNDSVYIFYNDINFGIGYSKSNYNEINSSYNYGNTFKPTYLPDTSNSLLSWNLGPIVKHFSSDGSGFIGFEKVVDTDKNNIAITQDAGRTFKLLSLNNFYSSNSNKLAKGSNVIEINNNYMFICTDSYEKSGTMFYFTDKNFENFRYITYDSLFYVHHILAEEFENFLMFCSVKEDRDHNFSSFEVFETNDSGKTKTSICKIEDSLAVKQIYELNKDSVFFAVAYPARLLMYDRKRNTFDNLYENADLDSIFFMELSGKFYILGEELFLENTDRNDLTKWEDAPWDYGRPTFTSVICKGNVALVGLSDSLRPFNYYRMMTEEHAPVGVEIQAEKLYYTNHFYAGNPYPLPGRNLIKTLISYDMSFDLEESIMGIYDLSGEKVQGKENIKVNHLNKASAEFIWNCSAVPSGIYFILVRHNGITDSIPIVVEK